MQGEKKLKIFEEFSSNLGLAFQIKDDLLDVEGDEKEIGKKTKKDKIKGKETLITLMGKDKARKKSQDLINKSIKILEKFGRKAQNLIDLTNFIISRRKNNLMLKTEVYKNKLKDKRLDTLLVEIELVSSRQKAISLIMRGNVFVGEEEGLKSCRFQ